MLMPDLKVLIGGRNFNISCNPGEENAAKESADLLNQEAELLHSQLGRLPEDKMLLLSGLLLGDKIRALKHEQNALKETLSESQAKINELHSKSKVVVDGSSKSISQPNISTLVDTYKDKAVAELQDISDMLDKIISKIDISYSKEHSEKTHNPPDDEAQDSFL
jgi:cell division protein ZapA